MQTSIWVVYRLSGNKGEPHVYYRPAGIPFSRKFFRCLSRRDKKRKGEEKQLGCLLIRKKVGFLDGFSSGRSPFNTTNSSFDLWAQGANLVGQVHHHILPFFQSSIFTRSKYYRLQTPSYSILLSDRYLITVQSFLCWTQVLLFTDSNGNGFPSFY